MDRDSRDVMNVMEMRAINASSVLVMKGFSCNQENGQRITINYQLSECQHRLFEELDKTEVYVHQIPRDVFEDEVIDLLMQAGTIYKIRWMMDFSGYNRGYFYVKYTNREDAKRAVDLLHGYPLRDINLKAQLSKDSKVLYFGNLPPGTTAEGLVYALRRQAVGDIVAARLDTGRYKTSCFVAFKSHRAATKARRLLIPKVCVLNGHNLAIDWAKKQFPGDLDEGTSLTSSASSTRSQFDSLPIPYCNTINNNNHTINGNDTDINIRYINNNNNSIHKNQLNQVAYNELSVIAPIGQQYQNQLRRPNQNYHQHHNHQLHQQQLQQYQLNRNHQTQHYLHQS